MASQNQTSPRWRKNIHTPKDEEKGKTPAATPGGPTPNPAAAPAAAGNANRGSSTGKKVLIALAVVGIVVGVAVGLRYAVKNKNSGSNSTGKSNSNGNNNNGGGDNTNGGTPTSAPTPVPEIPPIRLATCAIAGQLGTAKYYNAMFSGDFWANASQVGGRLAVGGNAYLNYFSAGNTLYGNMYFDCPNPQLSSSFPLANYALLVVGNLTVNSSQVLNGGAIYGSDGGVNMTIWQVQTGCPLKKDSSLDLSANFVQLRAASDAIAAMNAGFSKTLISGTNLTLKLNGSLMTEYFVIPEETLVNMKYIKLEGTQKSYNGTKATIVINVVLGSNSYGNLLWENFGYEGFSDEVLPYVLWNFNAFNSITFRGAIFPGSVLAIDASFDSTSGTIKGSVYGRSWNTNMDSVTALLESYPFKGELFTTAC